MLTPKRKLAQVSDSLWKRLKLRCLKDGITLAEGLEDAIRLYLSNSKPIEQSQTANGRS